MTDRIDNAINHVDITRRHFLAGSAMAGFAAFLAACGTSGTGSAAPSAGATTAATTPPAGSLAPTAEATAAAAPSGGGKLNFANLIGYLVI